MASSSGFLARFKERFGMGVSAMELADLRGQVAAIGRAQAVIEFDLKGNILRANDNFLNALGYTAAEIVGQHHSLFVEPAYRESQAYRDFWAKLGRGEFDAAVYLRIGKGGKEVWIQATYNPIFDAQGHPFKVVKFATDITAEKLRAADHEGQINAIGRSQAVIEFDLNGRVLTANDNFLKVLGYTLDEIKGQHHSLFVEPSFRESAEYRNFWAALGRGEFQSAQYKRIGKGGRVVYIQATYNPVFDSKGKPVKVVKFAQDVTREATLQLQLGAAVDNVVKANVEGDLTVRVKLENATGVLEALANAINQLLDSSADLVRKVRHAAGEVRSGAEEISRGNGNLSQRTEEQASSLEETASSMEQMTGTVRQTADNAAQANTLAVAAREQAEKGGSVVNSAVEAMGHINESSKKIADIIGVIDEIAFQTNLLALNAAVEAARAGEQGRGFAVVASEVRNLAGRSATAAREIKQLISDSVAKVEEGSKLVDASGKTLADIVSAVKKVTGIVSEIASASQEENSGIEQVNKAVMQMDEATQQNAALVEQAAAASQAIVDQANALYAIVERYKLAGGDSGSPSSAGSGPSSPPRLRLAAGR